VHGLLAEMVTDRTVRVGLVEEAELDDEVAV
jgi:hypothetical protein